jgi:preprotein translocase subunit SecE
MSQGIVGFARSIGNEMKKVSWPTREQLQESTVVTIATCVIIMTFVFIVDAIFTQFFSAIF